MITACVKGAKQSSNWSSDMSRRRSLYGRKEVERETLLASVHEAGHAVSRFLTSDAMGLKKELAVYSITYSKFQPPTTWGPWLSPEIDDGKPGTIEDVRRLVRTAQAKGLDVTLWARAKAFQAIMGPVAEAKFLRKAFRHVGFADQCMNDRNDLARDCSMADADSDIILAELIPTAMSTLERSDVWRCVLALASAVRVRRGLNNTQILAIAKLT